ncbi:MAG: tetratricopeptide repeat protein, partial [Burkholderiales bacterium]
MTLSSAGIRATTLIVVLAAGVSLAGVVLGAQAKLADEATLQQLARLIERGELEAAGRAADAALKTQPGDPVLHNLAGVIAAQRGGVTAAEAHFREAIRLAPKSPAAYENLGRLYQERAATDAGMRAKAIAVYRKLLEVDPRSHEALFQGGLLLALDGQFAASRAMLDRLTPEVRERPQAMAIVAADMGALGDMTGARRAIESLAAHPALTEADVMAAVAVSP